MNRPLRSVVFGMMAAISFAACAGSAHAYDLTIGFSASLHDTQAGLHIFGVRDGASNGVDLFDRPEPPPPPGDFLRLAFTMPDYDGPLANAWREEYRDPAVFDDDHREVWHVVVATDIALGELVLTFDVDLGWGIDFTLRYLGPPYDEIVVPVPSTLVVPLTGTEFDFWLELSSEGPVDAAAATWSDVKALFH